MSEAHSIMLDADKGSLARDLAMNIQRPEEVLETYGLRMHDLERLKTDPEFNRVFQVALAEWNSADSTPKRIRVKTAAMVEMGLPELWKDFMREKTGMQGRLDILKALGQFSGMLSRQGEGVVTQGTQAGGFSVTINIGNETVKVVGNPAPQTIEHEG